MSSPRRGIVVLVGCLALFYPGFSIGETEKEPKPGVVFLSPQNGASIREGGVVLIGLLPTGFRWANVLLNRRPLEVSIKDGRAFSLVITPQKGLNEVEARSGGHTSRLHFTYGIRTPGRSPFTYHRPVLEGKCGSCHPGGEGKKDTREAALCAECHRTMVRIFPYIHGPVAAGKCFVCHEPHGSSQPFLLRAQARELCTSCHDQPSSMRHATTSRSKVCYLCHNPHGSMFRHLLNQAGLVQ